MKEKLHILCIFYALFYACIMSAAPLKTSQTKFFKKALRTIRIICLALMMTENLSQLINNFFANEKIRPYLFNRFVTTLVGLK